MAHRHYAVLLFSRASNISPEAPEQDYYIHHYTYATDNGTDALNYYASSMADHAELIDADTLDELNIEIQRNIDTVTAPDYIIDHLLN